MDWETRCNSWIILSNKLLVSIFFCRLSLFLFFPLASIFFLLVTINYTEKGLSVKNDLVQSSVGIMRSMQARKYAGMCLLIILFSLGLFLNAAPQGARFGADVSSDRYWRQKDFISFSFCLTCSSRIVELNNETPFRGFKTTNPENAATAPRLSSEKKEKSEKKEDKPYDEECIHPFIYRHVSLTFPSAISRWRK